MTAFTTLFLKNAAPERGSRRLSALAGIALSLLLLLSLSVSASTEITKFQLERVDDGLALSSQLQFDLAPVVEDALLKGIPLFFVYEADTYRDRWYWTDPRVASVARTVRLAYQPLTRRWRVNIAAGVIGNSGGLRASLNQNYESLAEALTGIQRLTRWRFAEHGELAADSVYRLEFSFRLDLSQLPRPFQIGVAGQPDWAVAAQIKERIRPELLRAEAAR